MALPPIRRPSPSLPPPFSRAISPPMARSSSTAEPLPPPAPWVSRQSSSIPAQPSVLTLAIKSTRLVRSRLVAPPISFSVPASQALLRFSITVACRRRQYASTRRRRRGPLVYPHQQHRQSFGRSGFPSNRPCPFRNPGRRPRPRPRRRSVRPNRFRRIRHNHQPLRSHRFWGFTYGCHRRLNLGHLPRRRPKACHHRPRKQAAPGGGFFDANLSFTGAFLNAAGQVAFFDSLVGSPSSPTGIFRGDGNSLVTIARVAQVRTRPRRRYIFLPWHLRDESVGPGRLLRSLVQCH